MSQLDGVQTIDKKELVWRHELVEHMVTSFADIDTVVSAITRLCGHESSED